MELFLKQTWEKDKNYALQSKDRMFVVTSIDASKIDEFLAMNQPLQDDFELDEQKRYRFVKVAENGQIHLLVIENISYLDQNLMKKLKLVLSRFPFCGGYRLNGNNIVIDVDSEGTTPFDISRLNKDNKIMSAKIIIYLDIFITANGLYLNDLIDFDHVRLDSSGNLCVKFIQCVNKQDGNILRRAAVLIKAIRTVTLNDTADHRKNIHFVDQLCNSIMNLANAKWDLSTHVFEHPFFSQFKKNEIPTLLTRVWDNNIKMLFGGVPLFFQWTVDKNAHTKKDDIFNIPEGGKAKLRSVNDECTTHIVPIEDVFQVDEGYKILGTEVNWKSKIYHTIKKQSQEEPEDVSEHDELDVSEHDELHLSDLEEISEYSSLDSNHSEAEFEGQSDLDSNHSEAEFEGQSDASNSHLLPQPFVHNYGDRSDIPRRVLKPGDSLCVNIVCNGDQTQYSISNNVEALEVASLRSFLCDSPFTFNGEINGQGNIVFQLNNETSLTENFTNFEDYVQFRCIRALTVAFFLLRSYKLRFSQRIDIQNIKCDQNGNIILTVFKCIPFNAPSAASTEKSALKSTLEQFRDPKWKVEQTVSDYCSFLDSNTHLELNLAIFNQEFLRRHMTQGYFFSCLLGKEVVVVDLENDARISRFAGPAVSTNVVKIGDYFLEIFFTAVRFPKYVSSMESDQSYIFHLIHERNFLYSDLPIRIVANQMSVVDENRGRSDVEIKFEKNDYAFINKVKLFVEQCPFMYDKYEEKKSGNSVVWSFKEYKGPKVMLNDSLKDKQKLDILKSLLTVLLESQRNCLYLVKKIPPANMLLDTENNLKVHWICFSSKKSDQIGFALASLESMRMMGDDIDRRIDAVKNFIEQHGFTADIFDQDFLSETYPMNLNGWKMLTVMSGSSVYFYDKTGPSVYRLKEDNLTNFEIWHSPYIVNLTTDGKVPPLNEIVHQETFGRYKMYFLKHSTY